MFFVIKKNVVADPAEQTVTLPGAQGHVICTRPGIIVSPQMDRPPVVITGIVNHGMVKLSSNITGLSPSSPPPALPKEDIR